MDKSNLIFEKLLSKSKEATRLTAIEQLLSWDLETYMPAMGDIERSKQIAIIAELIHKQKTGSSFKNLLNELIDFKTGKYKHASLTEDQKKITKIWKDDYLKEKKLPVKFVKNMAQKISISQKKWFEAKEKKDFDIFLPHLEEIVELNIKKAKYLGYKNHIYDALLDLYEPEITTEIIDPLFNELKEKIILILKNITTKKEIDNSFLHKHLEKNKQLKLSEIIMNIQGLNNGFCRIDESAHPFSTSLNNSDIRMTTRIDENNFISNIFTTLHEGGHSLYQRQLPEKFYGTPLAEPISFGIHESQSRWWETFIGRSECFSSYLFSILKKEIPSILNNITFQQYYKAINKVSPSFIRVEADEITYSLHIIIRYEIEKMLINKELKVKEIPQAWNKKMKEYLNITPPNDSLGCLQDVHWSCGYFGYFPSYTLGNIYAASLFDQFKKEIPNFDEKIKNGNISFINSWLYENIHKYGRKYSPGEIIKKITKENMSAKSYITYLEKKFSDIYEF